MGWLVLLVVDEGGGDAGRFVWGCCVELWRSTSWFTGSGALELVSGVVKKSGQRGGGDDGDGDGERVLV